MFPFGVRRTKLNMLQSEWLKRLDCKVEIFDNYMYTKQYSKIPQLYRPVSSNIYNFFYKASSVLFKL